jgi:NUMOD4 motif/NUMOD1 domain
MTDTWKRIVINNVEDDYEINEFGLIRHYETHELLNDITGMVETWKQIILDEVEYHYEVSDLARVRNMETNLILKQKLRSDGYLTCNLHKDGVGKTCRVHRLVAYMFIPNPENKPHVNHINRKRFFNHLVNLEWCTRNENMEHALTNPNRRTTSKKIILYKEDCVTVVDYYDSIRSAANDLNILEANISNVLCGRCIHTGENKYHFKYVDPKLELTDNELIEFVDMDDLPNHMIHLDGRVYSKRFKIVLTGTISGKYLSVSCDSIDYFVHRLIAKRFIPNPDNKPCVNHIDGTDTLDNHVDNLEWATIAENSQHAHDTGLNTGGMAVKQYKFDGTFVDQYKSIADACRANDLDEEKCASSITKCCKYKLQTSCGFIWRYAHDTTPIVPIAIEDHRMKKPVNLYKLDGTFIDQYKSIADACRANDLDEEKCASSITKCCKYKLKTSCGFIWRYANDTTPIVPIVIEDHRMKKPVNRYKLDGTFIAQYTSAIEACRLIKELDEGYASSIAKCCKGKQKSAYGSLWRYALSVSDTASISVN